MKTTIRVKLSDKAIKIIGFESNDGLKSNKCVIDGFVSEESVERLKNDLLRRNVDGKKITSIKAKFKEEFKNSGAEYKSYVVSEETKKLLKNSSKQLGLTIGIVLSIIIEKFLDDLTRFVIDRSDKTKELLAKMFEIKKKIYNDVYQMDKYWQEICTLHSEDETKTPFYQTLLYFFEGFYGFDEDLKQFNME